MGIIILLCFSLAVFFNAVLYRWIDKYRVINNGIEVYTSERNEANFYRFVIIIAAGVTIFFSDYWWAPVSGYFLGALFGSSISNEDTVLNLIVYGKILKPLALIGAIVCVFV